APRPSGFIDMPILRLAASAGRFDDSHGTTATRRLGSDAGGDPRLVLRADADSLRKPTGYFRCHLQKIGIIRLISGFLRLLLIETLRHLWILLINFPHPESDHFRGRAFSLTPPRLRMAATTGIVICDHLCEPC